MKAATAQVRAVTMQANRLRKTEKQCVSVCYTHPRTGLIIARWPVNWFLGSTRHGCIGAAWPHLKLGLFDLPEVAETGAKLLGEALGAALSGLTLTSILEKN